MWGPCETWDRADPKGPCFCEDQGYYTYKVEQCLDHNQWHDSHQPPRSLVLTAADSALVFNVIFQLGVKYNTDTQCSYIHAHVQVDCMHFHENTHIHISG